MKRRRNTKEAQTLYRLAIDSVKLFFMNVLLYIILLESYAFITVIQLRFSVDLPFFDVFFSGIATLVAVVIWMNVVRFSLTKGTTMNDLLRRSIGAQTPFLILCSVVWLIPSVRSYLASGMSIVILLTGYLVLFPLVVAASKTHVDQLEFVRTES